MNCEVSLTSIVYGDIPETCVHLCYIVLRPYHIQLDFSDENNKDKTYT